MVGRELNQYRILSRLGKGGMGEVYLAHDTELDRKVALKILPPEMAESSQRVERFKREARAVAALSHPNIVTIHSVEEARGVHFLTMELVSGKTLDALIPKDGLPLDRIFDVAIPLADALSEAHAKGITHRDLKPANVMVTDDGRVKVLDFGLAKFREPIKGEDGRSPTRTLTQEGTLVGTMPYMSPEQIKGAPVDHRSDIFSFGVMLYEMATGKRPFVGESSAELISSLLRDDPPVVSDINTAVPRHLGRIIRLCLAKDPAQRYQSAADVRNELRALRTEVASGVTEPPVRPPVSRKRTLPVVALGGLLLAVAAAIVAWQFIPPGRVATPQRAQVSIAVLPFRNMSGDAALAFLSLAVPDEVTTALSRAPGLSLRPFSSATRYTGDDVDVPAAGRELHASTIVTGQFFRQGPDLRLTLEAVDVGKNEIVWRDGVTVRADDLLALRGQVSDRIRTGLVPDLVGTEAVAAGTQPSSPEAYDLYLRSLAISPDPGPGLEATRMLERAVALDPNFAPAWAELGERYSFEAAYGPGGDPFYPKAMDALRRALALDPNLPQAAGWLLQMEVESGHLEQGYDTARALLERSPRSAALHFSMSYVLRYAGLFDEAARECDTAYGLDSSDPAMRSCGITFYMLGDYERAEVFFTLSDDSQFSIIQRWNSLMRQRKDREALAMIERFREQSPIRRFGVRCLEGAKPEELAALAPPFAASIEGQRDGESQYLYGGIFARCGERQAALVCLRRAVEHNYCAYPLMESDPLLESLRGDPEFEKIVAAGRACRDRFVKGSGLVS